MTVVGRIIRGFVKIITSIFKGLAKEAKQLIPVAIAIVNAIKFAIENPITGNIIDFILEAIKKQIPGTADDFLIEKAKAILKVWLPKILDGLKVADEIARIEDDNERMLAILNEIKFKGQDEKTLLYNNIACLLTSKLSDDEITLEDALVAVPLTYKHPEVLNA